MSGDHDHFEGFPKTTEEQVLEQLKEIKELLRRQDPTRTVPGEPFIHPTPANPWCPCRHYGPYWEIPLTVTCSKTEGGLDSHAVWQFSYKGETL